MLRVFCPWYPKRAFNAVLAHSRQFSVTEVSFTMFSSNLSDFEQNQTEPKRSTNLKLQNSKNRSWQNLNYFKKPFINMEFKYKLKQKNYAYGRHWLSLNARIIALCQKLNKKIWSYLEHLSVLKVYMGTIRNRTRGQSTHPIWNTSPFLRLNAAVLFHVSNNKSNFLD